MAKLFEKAAAPVAETPANARKDSECWLNIGVTLAIPQEDGSVVDEFISMPVGIALDNQTPMKVTGKNVAWHHKVQAKNMILAFLQKVAGGLEPGQGELIEDLQIQVFRRNEAPEEAAPGENPLLAQMGRLVG